MLVLMLFSFAYLSGQKLNDPPTNDRILNSSVLKSDSIPESSVVLLNATFNKLPGEDDDPLLHLEYTNYPICQVRPLDFAAEITNTDSINLTGVFLEISIANQYNYEETFNSETIGIASGDTVQLVIPDFTPPSEGTYQIEYSIHWDQQDNNQLVTHTRSFGATADSPNVFSRDNGEMIATSSDMGNGETFMAGLFYSFTHNDQICCLGVKFGPESEANSVVSLELRDPIDLEFLVSTTAISPGNDTFGDEAFHWAPLEYPFWVVEENPLYNKLLATVRVYDPEESVVNIGISSHNAADSSAYIFGVFGETDCTAGCPTNDLYMIRVGMSNSYCTTRIAEIADQVSDFFCAPNPVSGPFTVHYTLLERADIQFFLFDNMGRVVARQNSGTQLPGKHTMISDAAGLAGGVYTATIIANGKSVSKQVVIR